MLKSDLNSSPLCGIDEAGRGPLAGDLVMAGVILKYPLNKHLKELNDSKKLSEKKREFLYDIITKNSEFHIVSFSAKNVDKNGISACLEEGLISIMITINTDNFLFDGNSTFGVENLKTLVKADATIAEVSAASILAKVTHDRAIVEMSKQYPEYGFERHKGYGTKHHVEMIKKHGYCEVHRKTYKIKALEKTLFD